MLFSKEWKVNKVILLIIIMMNVMKIVFQIYFKNKIRTAHTSRIAFLTSKYLLVFNFVER